MTMTFSVAIDWDNNGNFTTPGDDITAYFQDIGIQLGITEPDARVAAVGSCDITLDNTDKRFTPLNASGPYYSKLVSNKPVQIQITDENGSTWTLFQGYTRAWKPQTGMYGEKRCSLSCVDMLAKLQDDNIAVPIQQNVTGDVLIKHILNTILKAPVATGTITIGANNASNNNTVTINGVTFTFKTTLSGAANEIKIGAVSGDTLVNLIAAVNRDTGAGTNYSSTVTKLPVSAAVTTGGGFAITGNSGAIWVVGTASGSQYQAGCRFTGVSGPLTTITAKFLANGGAPTGTMTWEIQSDANGVPSGTVLQTGTFTPTASATNTINVVSGVTLVANTTYHLLFYSTAVQTTGNYWQIDGSVDTLARTVAISKVDSTWNIWSGYELAVSIFTPCVTTLTALLRGTIGNGYPLAAVGANLSVSGAALSGGVDYPTAPASSLQTGVLAFTFAADTWSAASTNGITALTDVVESERGLFWIARNGTPTFKNQSFLFKVIASASLATIDSQHNDVDGALDHEEIFNRIEVEASPRAQLSTGVVAAAKSVITVPGQSGTARWNGTVALPGGGDVTVKLQAVDPTTGQPMGIVDVTMPLTANTDWTANDQSDGTGFDYTGAAQLSFSFVVNGSNIEASIKNTALGPLYITKFQVRGTGIVKYNPLTIAMEDATSQNTYGKRTKSIKLPLPTSDVFARAIARYELGRWKDAQYRMRSITFRGQTLISGLNLFAFEIGDTIILNDDQLGISGQRYMISGVNYAGLKPRDVGAVTWNIRRLDDMTYWILGDSTYGVLNVTDRLAI